MHAVSAPDRPRSWPVCLAVGLAVGAAVLAAAWISDDALVTFRTAENLAAGDGMRWNVLDRTQTATHPLWVLLLAAARWLTGELYFTAIGLGVACGAAAGTLLARVAPAGALPLATVALGLLGSASFVVFGTCGLENPLVYVLLAWFAHAWFRGEPGPRRLRSLAACAGLLALARQDLVLLVAPAVLAACRGVPRWAALRALLPGAVVVAAWYAFALVYYGTAIPTPGYGKVVAADVPQAALFVQGLWYLADLARHDAATAVVLLGALAAPFAPALRQGGRVLAPALGVLLQVLYTLRVGGDFMSGRFFTAAFVLALASVAVAARGGRGRIAVAVLGAAVAAHGVPEWARGTPPRSEARIEHGIGDERAYYAWQLGLWSPTRVPFSHGMLGGMFAGRPRPAVLLVHAAGVPGYLNGPGVHVVDPFLCDPLLMRLPLQDPQHWRIGHFKRRLPEGYLESLASGRNQVRHPALARYFEVLQVLLRAPVWSAERWRVWWGFRTGEYEPWLQQYVNEACRTPPLVELTAADLPAGRAAGAHWYDGGVVVREGGVRVPLPPGPAGTLRLLVDGGGVGELVYRGGAVELAREPFRIPGDLLAGARWVEWPVPVAARGATAVEVLPRLDAPAADAPLTVLEILAVLGCEVRP